MPKEINITNLLSELKIKIVGNLLYVIDPEIKEQEKYCEVHADLILEDVRQSCEQLLDASRLEEKTGIVSYCDIEGVHPLYSYQEATKAQSHLITKLKK